MGIMLAGKPGRRCPAVRARKGTYGQEESIFSFLRGVYGAISAPVACLFEPVLRLWWPKHSPEAVCAMRRVLLGMLAGRRLFPVAPDRVERGAVELLSLRE